MTPYAQMLLAYVRPEAQGVYTYEYDRYAKDSVVALVLTIFFGLFGGEAYYIGDWRRSLWMTLAFFTGIGLFITVPLWITRIFTVQSECEAYNDYVAWVLACRYLPLANAVEPPQPVPPRGKRPNISNLPMVVRA